MHPNSGKQLNIGIGIGHWNFFRLNIGTSDMGRFTRIGRSLITSYCVFNSICLMYVQCGRSKFNVFLQTSCSPPMALFALISTSCKLARPVGHFNQRILYFNILLMSDASDPSNAFESYMAMQEI